MLNLKDGTLFQWDTGRKVVIDLRNGHTIDKVQFYNGIGDNAYPATSIETINGEILAGIPNSLLCYANNLTVYLMTTDEDGVKTQEQITLAVNRRAKPEDYIFTDDEFHTYKVYDERLLDLEKNVVTPDKLKESTDTEVKALVPEWAREVSPDVTLTKAGEAADAAKVGNAISKLEKSVSSPYNSKGSVESFDKLPSKDNVVNDTYYVVEEKCKFTWNGTEWYQSSMSEAEYAEELSQLRADMEAADSQLSSEIGDLNDIFHRVPNNFLDYKTIEVGKQLQQTSDNLADSSAYSTSGYVPVKEGETICFGTNKTTQSVVFLKGYDNNKIGFDWKGNISYYIVPKGVEYIRTTFYTEWVDYQFQICKDSLKEYSDYFPPYFSVNRDTLEEEVKRNIRENYIVAWGDSLTQQGGWTDVIAEKSGLIVYNAGVGGETAYTIMARQGADQMIVNNITIPASSSESVVVGTYANGGIDTKRGNKAMPLANANIECMNPCSIAGVVGNLVWDGANPTDANGKWLFTRLEDGESVKIYRPTAIISNYQNKNNGVVILWMGTNGGYGTEANLVDMFRKTIEHSNCGNKYVVLGVCNNTAEALAGFESNMEEEFGEHFLNIREYLSHPVYWADGVSLRGSYGILDAGLTMTDQDKTDIENGRIPSSLRADSTHFNNSGKTVIGNWIYKQMHEMGII